MLGCHIVESPLYMSFVVAGCQKLIVIGGGIVDEHTIKTLQNV